MYTNSILRLCTRRRYTRGVLKKLLAEHGFTVRKISYANTSLFPLAVAKRVSEKVFPLKRKGSDLTISTGFVNRLFTGLLSVEAPFVRTVGLPFGLTLVVLAQKPESPEAGKQAQ